VIAVSGCTRQKHVSSLLIGGEPGRYTRKTTKDELPRFADKTTFADCLAYAALNNAGLEAAFNRWKTALEKVPQVNSLPDPQFSYSYEIETRVGP